MVLDPHGDLGRSVMSFAMQDRKRLYYLSSAINREADVPKGQEYSFVFNPFISDPEMHINLTETLTECLCELLQEATLTPQMISVLKPCIATVLRLREIGKIPSIAELNRFFLDGQADDLVALGKISPVEQHRIFFTYEWNNDNLQISKKSIRVKLSYLLSDPRLANMLSGESTFPLEKAIEDGAVIVWNLPKGSGVNSSKVMLKFLNAFLYALMLKRDIQEPDARRQIYVIADEFQSYVSPSISNSMAELRKYKLSLVLATQSLMQIPDTIIRKTISVNAGLKAIGMTDHADRQAMAKEIGHGIDAEDIEKLRTLQFYLKRNDGKHQPLKFDVPVLNSTYFLTKKEKKALLHWLVYESGQYRLVPPPHPLPSEQFANPSNNRRDGGLKPAF